MGCHCVTAHHYPACPYAPKRSWRMSSYIPVGAVLCNNEQRRLAEETTGFTHLQRWYRPRNQALPRSWRCNWSIGDARSILDHNIPICRGRIQAACFRAENHVARRILPSLLFPIHHNNRNQEQQASLPPSKPDASILHPPIRLVPPFPQEPL